MSTHDENRLVAAAAALAEAQRSGVSEERFTEAIGNIRSEIQSGLMTAGVQIGAVEKTVVEKISSLRAWGIAAIVTSNIGGGLLAAWLRVDPTGPQSAVGAVTSFLGFS